MTRLKQTYPPDPESNSRFMAIVRLLALSLTMTACTWRHGDTSHYIGPVLFRQVSPPEGNAYVNQVVRIGGAMEVGKNWGLNVGFTSRTAISPVDMSGGPASLIKNKPEMFKMSLFSNDEKTAGWQISPLYLRVQNEFPLFFVSRTTWGFGLVVGEEATELSVGYSEKTRSNPPEDSIAHLRFIGNNPLASKASIWRGISKSGDLTIDKVGDIINEAEFEK